MSCSCFIAARASLLCRALCPVALALCGLASGCGDQSETPPTFAASPHPSIIPRYGLFALSLQHEGRYENPFLDTGIMAVFVAPDGSRHQRAGFYYGRGIWMVRFRPHLPGGWAYTWTFTGREGVRKQGDGSFECSPAEAGAPVRRHPRNPHRWMLSTEQPWYPVGLQDCVGTDSGSVQFEIDGEGREDSSARRLTADEYFRIYGESGFNLFRFSQKNCSYALFDSLDKYRERESIVTDEVLATARERGFRTFFGFFGYHGHWYKGSLPGKILHAIRLRLGANVEALDDPDDLRTLEKEKRFIAYCIARWGVYADFWELLNERRADDRWLRAMAAYVRSIDPDEKPVTTSWDKPELSELDFVAPHWYESEREYDSDLRVQQQAFKWKRFGKPVIFGEQGNSGMNWDPTSALRMRLRLWTSLFYEVAAIFWHTGWSKAGMHLGRYSPGQASNIYLGPEERRYVRAWRSFTSRLDGDIRMTGVTVSEPDRVRAYGLVSARQAAVYLHHYANHEEPISSVEVRIDRPAAARHAEWIDPATGSTLQFILLAPGAQRLCVPPFRIDIALLISAD